MQVNQLLYQLANQQAHQNQLVKVLQHQYLQANQLQLQHLTTRTQLLSQQARATLRQLVRAKALQHLYQQVSVLANQHQAQQQQAKVLQQVQA